MFTASSQGEAHSEDRPPAHKLVAILEGSLDRLARASLGVLAGDNAFTVNRAVEHLVRSAAPGGPTLGTLRKIVPMVDRDDALRPGDLRFLLQGAGRRICARVLNQSATPAAEIDSVVTLVLDCATAWAYDATSRPSVVKRIRDRSRASRRKMSRPWSHRHCVQTTAQRRAVPTALSSSSISCEQKFVQTRLQSASAGLTDPARMRPRRRRSRSRSRRLLSRRKASGMFQRQAAP